jgi:O-antigen/teichoic acid export membrane protein
VVGLGKQTVVLTGARLANYGLMLISPIILVRLLSVEQFGQYRLYILYASFLQLVAAFAFAESLLYFIPAHSKSVWRVIAQTNLLTACSSVAVVTVLGVSDIASHGAVIGHDLLPLMAYVLLFVNVDFWEYYFLATHRPVAVFAYTAGRLSARMAVVIILAYVTANVQIIIWSLVALEGARLIVAGISWRLLDRSATEPKLHGLWRDQLRYCVPAGAGMFLYMANRNLGNIAVAKVLGSASLAHYTIGTYAEYVYLALGNSIAAVVLPEMVRRNARESGSGLLLWQKTTIVNCILLLPTALLGARYAAPLINTIFGHKYAPAAAVMQIHMLFLVRACFDFSPAVRAINKTRALVYSNVAGLAANACALTVLLPLAGIRGAVGALVISSIVEALVLGIQAGRFYKVPLAKFIPWKGVAKVAAATLLAGVILLIPQWDRDWGLPGIAVVSCLYYASVGILLRVAKVPEAEVLLRRVKNFVGSTLSTAEG